MIREMIPHPTWLPLNLPLTRRNSTDSEGASNLKTAMKRRLLDFDGRERIRLLHISSAVPSTTRPPVQPAEIRHFLEKNNGIFHEQTGALDHSWTISTGLSAGFYLPSPIRGK